MKIKSSRALIVLIAIPMFLLGILSLSFAQRPADTTPLAIMESRTRCNTLLSKLVDGIRDQLQTQSLTDEKRLELTAVRNLLTRGSECVYSPGTYGLQRLQKEIESEVKVIKENPKR